MGISRLTSFVDNNFTGWQRQEIREHLIIDGFSMCYNLYSFDWSHGGQYPEYRDKLTDFFISLNRSGITPIVVMDGIDFKEEKTETILKRRNEVIKIIHKHTANTQKRNIEAVVDGVLPSLAIDVFMKLMIELNVTFIVADGEGDTVIYELANAYCCPVLSQDSDFFIYNLRGGYIPFNRFHWEASPINAEVYHYQAFCEQFKFQDETLRLIIPAIAGNDFIHAVDSPNFLGHIGREIEMDTKGLHRLIGVIRYISLYKSLDDFMSHIKSFSGLDSTEKERLYSNCLESQKTYNSDKVTSLEEINANTELLAFNSESIPEWMIKQFRSGNLSNRIMESLVVGKCLLDIFVDNTAMSSCVLTSLQIRQFIYGLSGSSRVTEYYRDSLELAGKGIRALDSVNGRSLPPLSRIHLLSKIQREQLLYAMLGYDDHTSLDSEWKLVMAATVFWARHVNPSPHIIKALILSFVVCSTCPLELPRMRSQFFIPVDFRRSHKWMIPLHAFAQWQSTYLDTISLNQLLMLPLESISPALLYDGKLAMFFSLPENGDHFVAMLPINHQLYRDLVNVVLPHHFTSPPPVQVPPPRSHRNISDQPPRFQNTSRGRQGHASRGQGQGQFSNIRGESRDHTRGRGRGRGKSHTDNGRSLSTDTPKNRDSGQNRRGHGRGHSKAASRGAKLPRAKIAVSEEPKFTHANRYASLLGDEDEENLSESD